MRMSLSCFIHLAGQAENKKKSFDGEVILLIYDNGINFGISLSHFRDHSQTMLPCARQWRWWGQGCQENSNWESLYFTPSKHRLGLT